MLSVSTLLFETIKIEDGHIYNIEYHQKRCNSSRKKLFHTEEVLDLARAITPPPKGLYRCRIVYAIGLYSIEYIPYYPRKINYLKVVTSTLNYSHKYLNRDTFNTLLTATSDDILISHNGIISDTSISNIAFYKDGQWYTPAKPLLLGTTRARLLDEGFLTTANITLEDLSTYTQVALMNAMLGFKIIKEGRIEDLEGMVHDY